MYLVAEGIYSIDPNEGVNYEFHFISFEAFSGCYLIMGILFN